MSGHTWAGVLGPISPPGIAIGGLQDGSKRPQNAINWVYVAINSPGGFKIVKVEMKYLKLLAFTMPAHCAVS